MIHDERHILQKGSISRGLHEHGALQYTSRGVPTITIIRTMHSWQRDLYFSKSFHPVAHLMISLNHRNELQTAEDSRVSAIDYAFPKLISHWHECSALCLCLVLAFCSLSVVTSLILHIATLFSHLLRTIWNTSNIPAHSQST